MFHIVESCPLTKLNGGLSQLHSADEDQLWFDTHTRRRRRLKLASFDVYDFLMVRHIVNIARACHLKMSGDRKIDRRVGNRW